MATNLLETITACEHCGELGDRAIEDGVSLTVLTKLVARATMWEPAEYEELVVCPGCEEALTREIEPSADDLRDDW